MRLHTLAFIPLLLAASLAQADAIDDIVLAEMKRSNTPGISLAIVRDGKIIREQGYGLANVEHQVPVKPETIFQSGSVGKQFAAALVMLLAEEGKLKLDAPISRYLARTPGAWKNITVRHLLTHTSGMGDPGDKVDLRRDYTDAQLIALAAAAPVRFPPGQRWEYSNTGYQLLGFICNKVGGKFYGDQLRERIFAPTGMGTRIISERDIIAHRAAGYEMENGKLKNQNWVSPTMNSTADGSLYLTARDLALWDLALYGDKPLSARIKEAIWSPVKLNDGTSFPYGFGWNVKPLNGHKHISHNGSWQGFRSVISRFVDDKLTIIVLGNSATAPPDKIASQIARHLVPDLEMKPLADTEPAITARARDIIAHFERAQQPPGLSKKAKAVFTPAFLAYVVEDLRNMGKLNGVEPVERIVKGETRGYAYRMRFENETVIMKFGINKAGELEGVDLEPY